MYYVLQHTVGLLGDFNMMKNIGGTEKSKELDDKKPNKNNSKNPKMIVLLIHEEIFLYLYNSI